MSSTKSQVVMATNLPNSNQSAKDYQQNTTTNNNSSNSIEEPLARQNSFGNNNRRVSYPSNYGWSFELFQKNIDTGHWPPPQFSSVCFGASVLNWVNPRGSVSLDAVRCVSTYLHVSRDLRYMSCSIVTQFFYGFLICNGDVVNISG